eukprot:1469483-Alexandrium_andersonii.AAC.1
MQRSRARRWRAALLGPRSIAGPRRSDRTPSPDPPACPRRSSATRSSLRAAGRTARAGPR